MGKKILAVALVVIMLLSFAACGKSEEVKAVENTIKSIGEVTLDSKDAIDEARKAFSEMVDEEKSKVGNIRTLEKAESDYEDLLYREKALKIDEKILNIGKVSLKNEKKISEIRKEYEKSTDEVKQYVENLTVLEEAEKEINKLKIADVEKKIKEIGKVTLDSKEKIQEARYAYEALDKDLRKEVSNILVLESAEKEYKKISKELNKAKADQLKKYYKADYDKVQNLTWYMPKNMPNYIDTRSYVLPYIGVQNDNVWLCVRYNYTGNDWVFWKKIIIWIDGEKDYKFVSRSDKVTDNDTEVWEYYDECLPYNTAMNHSTIETLNKIANSKETVVRFEGDNYHYDLKVSQRDKQTIKETLELYEALLP